MKKKEEGDDARGAQQPPQGNGASAAEHPLRDEGRGEVAYGRNMMLNLKQNMQDRGAEFDRSMTAQPREPMTAAEQKRVARDAEKIEKACVGMKLGAKC